MAPSAREPLAYNNAAEDTTGGDCPDGNCGPPVEVADPELAEGEQGSPMSACQFLTAFGTLLLALPAIIGACCWPMVVAAIFNVGASVMNGGNGTGIVDFFHGFQVAIMMTLMFNLVQFVWWTCKTRRTGTFWEVHTPTLYTLMSAILVNIQPIWILCIGSWKLCCGTCATMGIKAAQCPASGMSYPPWSNGEARECTMGGNVFWGISYCGGQQYSIFPTQWQGWLIQIVCTWGGYILMFIGVFQATKLHLKLAAKWRAIRRGR